MIYTLYTGTNCPRCTEMKNYLDTKKIGYEEINVREDTSALVFLKQQGFTSIPQLFKDGKHVANIQTYKGAV